MNKTQAMKIAKRMLVQEGIEAADKWMETCDRYGVEPCTPDADLLWSCYMTTVKRVCDWLGVDGIIE
jgi:hypothetical protein